MTETPTWRLRLDTAIACTTFVVRRFFTAAIAMVGVTLIVFLLSHKVGDPVYILLGSTGTPQQIEQVRHEQGFDRPVIVQYFNYLDSLVHGDLGTSTFSRESVVHELATYFPATVELSLAALFITLVVAVPLGITAARFPRSIWSLLHSGLLRFGVAMPSFWFGLLLLWVFVYLLHVFPTPTGQLDIGLDSPPGVTGMVAVDAVVAGDWTILGNSLRHLVLPAVTLALGSMPAMLALTHAVTSRVLASDFMRSAYASGLPPRTLYGRYALRNIAPPVVTQLAMNFGFLLGGTVLVETVFAWPGIGQYSVLSMQRLDFEPVLGVAIVAAAIYLLLYLLADIISLLLDPRIRHDR